MTGWNRKALRMILPADAAESQVEAVEMICAISAAMASRLNLSC